MNGRTAAWVAGAAGARLAAGDSGGPGPRRAVIDTRGLTPGDLFVGLRGERVDGGGFAAEALDRGAWGVLVAPEHERRALARAGGPGRATPLRDTPHGDPRHGYTPHGDPRHGTPHGDPRHGTPHGDTPHAPVDALAVLVAPDPLLALQSLARAWRRALGCKVVGVTGSTGKTSTKDILAALLSPRLRTRSTRENLNTEIGLPLTILEAPAGTEALVLEMAMRGEGQIAELVGVAEPDVGVIVNVGPVHLELLGTVERVAAAKAELIRDLPPGAACVVPASEPLLAAHLRADLDTITFGPGGDVRLLSLDAGRAEPGSTDPDGVSPPDAVAMRDRARSQGSPSWCSPDHACLGLRRGNARQSRWIRAEIEARGRTVALDLPYAEPHNLLNTLAAVGAATALGASPGGRVEVRFSSLRGEVVELPGGVTVVNDCYNANPMSMRAALRHLADTPARRRVAVLGEMAELGPRSASFHREVGAEAAALGVDLMVTVGERAGGYAEGFDRETHAAATPAEAGALLRELALPGDRVLVKGSRSAGLEQVLAPLWAGR